MAFQGKVVLLLGSVLILTSGADVFERILEDVSPCTNTCAEKFATEDNEKNDLQDSCRRGCRLFSIMEFIYQDNLTETQNVCETSCEEAYNRTELQESCNLGCVSQPPFSAASEEDESESNIHVLYPFQFVHQIYSNMFDRMFQHMSTSWSFYMEDTNGQVVSMTAYKADPVFERFIIEEPFEDDFKTSNYYETNIEAQDRSATPMLKNSQMIPLQFESEDGINLSKRDMENQVPSDWMSCVAMKTGLPRLFISALILLCAIFMIWLCLTAIITAPDQKVTPGHKKLSINGDWEYIKEMRAQGQLQFPHAPVHKSKLPLDITVDRI